MNIGFCFTKANKLFKESVPFCFVFVLVFSIFGLWIASLVPQDLYYAKLREAVFTGGLKTVNYDVGKNGKTITDNYTECVALGMGLGGGDSTQQRVFFGRNLGNCYDLGMHFDKRSIRSEKVPNGYREQSAIEPEAYTRFWHGYQLISRPVLSFFGLSALRNICWTIFIASVCFYALRIRMFSGDHAPIWFLFVGFLFLDVRDLRANWIHSLSLSLMFLSAAISLSVDTKRKKWLFIMGWLSWYFGFLLNKT